MPRSKKTVPTASRLDRVSPSTQKALRAAMAELRRMLEIAIAELDERKVAK